MAGDVTQLPLWMQRMQNFTASRLPLLSCCCWCSPGTGPSLLFASFPSAHTLQTVQQSWNIPGSEQRNGANRYQFKVINLPAVSLPWHHCQGLPHTLTHSEKKKKNVCFSLYFLTNHWSDSMSHLYAIHSTPACPSSAGCCMNIILVVMLVTPRAERGQIGPPAHATEIHTEVACKTELSKE